MLRIIIPCFLILPFLGFAQYKGVSYELRNEVGTFNLTSLTVSHRIDNEEGFTFVTDKTGTDTLYQFGQFLNGFVGLSNDGRTVAHLQTEQNSVGLENVILTFYRDGKKFDSAKLKKLLKYELDDAVKRQSLPKSGWLRNDSLLHKMASNAFYVTDDKVFISTDGPLLHVLDMNQMLHIYTGNGANHFMQNYFSIPNLPFRTEFTSAEYFPKGFPQTENGQEFVDALIDVMAVKKAIPEDAKFRVEIELKLNDDGFFKLEHANVFSTITNELDQKRTEILKTGLKQLKLQTSLLPPNHPTWIFSENFWLK